MKAGEGMRKLLSIVMISFTICAIGGLFWLQKEIGNNKQDYQNYLMMRYQEPFDVSVKYNWKEGKFIGSFSKNGMKPFYHVEKYQDGTFYDNLLESRWKKEYEEKISKELKVLGASEKKIDVTIPKGTDAFLFGKEISFEGDIPLEEAMAKGLEKKMDIDLISKEYDGVHNKKLDTYYKNLSKRVHALNIDYPVK